MKCMRKKTTTAVIYTRVSDDEAKGLATQGWEYCGKQEYKRMVADSEVSHG